MKKKLKNIKEKIDRLKIKVKERLNKKKTNIIIKKEDKMLLFIKKIY